MTPNIADTKRIARPTWKRLLRSLEAGTGDDFAFLSYTTYIWFILMMGMIFAFVGFYRIGANYGSNYGVRVGALYDGTAVGEQRQETYLGQFTGATHDCNNCYVQLDGERMAEGSFVNQSDFPALFNIDGIDNNFDINAQSRVRLERFYPGPAKCDAAGNCYE